MQLAFVPLIVVSYKNLKIPQSKQIRTRIGRKQDRMRPMLEKYSFGDGWKNDIIFNSPVRWI